VGEPTVGVPYTVIGNQVFSGFSASYEKAMADAIEKQHENSFDVYFDRIQK